MTYHLINQTGSTGSLLRTDISIWTVYSLWAYVYLAGGITLCILGTLANFTVLFIIAASKKLRTRSGILIAHLSFIETSLCGIFYPALIISTYTAQYGPVGWTFCRYILFAYLLFFHTGNWATMTIAVNRFVAIIYPSHYGTFSSKPALLSWIIGSWIVALTCNLPGFYSNPPSYAVVPPWGACGTYPTLPLWLNTVTAVITVPVPIFIIAVAYTGVFCKVRLQVCSDRWCASAKSSMYRRTAERVIKRRRLASAKMLIVSSIWYTACYLPGPVLMRFATTFVDSYPLLRLYLRLLTLVGYTFNPVRKN